MCALDKCNIWCEAVFELIFIPSDNYEERDDKLLLFDNISVAITWHVVDES